MNYRENYKKDCNITAMIEVEPTGFEKNNLSAIRVYDIAGERFIIKPVYGYIGKYAVVKIGQRRKQTMLYNSDSIECLRKILKTKHCVSDPKLNADQRKFIANYYNREEWLPELCSDKWLRDRHNEKIKRQRAV